MKRNVLSFCLLLGLMLAAGCTPDEASVSDANPNAAPSQFDGMKIKVGDQVATMTVEQVDLQVAETMPEYGPIGTVRFSGEVEISGAYHFINDDQLGEQVFFEVDADSQAKLPKLQNDERDLLFLFENDEEAKKQFGPEPGKGRAVVKIDRYWIHYQPKEAYNTALLLEVKEKHPDPSH